MSRVYSSSNQKFPEKPGSRSKRVKSQGNERVEHIQHRAYEIYQERMQNNMPGDMISDWVKAEQEINSLETKN